MKFDLKVEPRAFWVGRNKTICINDLGDVHLAPNEQVTFVTDSGARFDFARKNWGYYATPSVNARLTNEGFKTALVENEQGRIYVMAVEVSQLEEFHRYCEAERQKVRCWLDEIGSDEP
jgi:hypothetical protein